MGDKSGVQEPFESAIPLEINESLNETSLEKLHVGGASKESDKFVACLIFAHGKEIIGRIQYRV